MIYYNASGQLGNQIFQYLFLMEQSKANERIYATGFGALISLFSDLKLVKLNSHSFTFKFIDNLAKWTAKLNLISTIYVKEDVVNGSVKEFNKIEFKCGIFKNIKYVKLGYFQSDYFFSHSNALKLKSSIYKKYIDSSKSIIRALPNNTVKNIFVHVRRGDYKDHKVFGKSVLLPSSYYRKAIQKCINDSKEIDFNFYFISDDIESVRNEFQDIENSYFVGADDYRIDFCLMIQCDGGILSASSFSWWGAYFLGNSEYVFAPKYWLGFSANIDYHENPTPKFFKLLSV